QQGVRRDGALLNELPDVEVKLRIVLHEMTPVALRTAARHLRNVLLPLRPEGEDEELLYQPLVLAQRDGHAPAPTGEIIVALLHLPVEVRHRRRLLELFT